MGSFLCQIWPYLAGGLIGWLASGWLARKALAMKPAYIDRVVEKPVSHIVEKIVTKTVDNPDHISEITRLSAVATLVPSLRQQISSLEATQKDTSENNVALQAANIRYAELENKYKQLLVGPRINMAAAKIAGFNLKSEDDLEIIEGIGPKIASLLKDAGITTFRELSQVTPEQIKAILERAGSNFALAIPTTWPEQAILAANNAWSSLKTLQNVLDKGKTLSSEKNTVI